MMRFTFRSAQWLVLLVLMSLLGDLGLGNVARAESPLPAAVMIVLTPAGELQVRPLPDAGSPQLPEGDGLIVVSTGERERVRFVPPRDGAAELQELSFASRLADDARTGGSSPGDSLGFATVQVDQLLGRYVVRGSGFLTPAGRVLDGRVTIRRSAEGRDDELDAAQVALRQGNRTLATISFDRGQQSLSWDRIPNLPKPLRSGLPPGEYTLREAGGGPATRFVVEPEEIRQWALEPVEEFKRLLVKENDPLYVQVAAEHLLGTLDEYGRPQPYLCDVLDLLETVPPETQTAHLDELYDDVVARLAGARSEAPSTEGHNKTGIDAIDRARRLIAAGQLREALPLLDPNSFQAEERAQSLALLYRGVVFSESGPTYEQGARNCFLEAIDRLQNGAPSDLFRAKNNYAGFLFGRVRDRLYNHAFQMATGVHNPLKLALVDWREAERQWRGALDLAAELPPEEQLAVKVNLARLHALLADIVRTLDVPENGRRNFLAGQQAAENRARQLAMKVADSPTANSEPMIAAVAQEVLADLAYRAGETRAAIDRAKAARRFYLQTGSLAGVEGVHRLIGQCYRRGSAGDRSEALRHLRISHALSEMLRERLGADDMGLSRAGFLARRSYVSQLLVELLLEEGQPVEALRFVELAKARALEDVLASAGKTASGRFDSAPDLDETLGLWPADVASLVYFLGTERAWVFLVDTSGNVTAHALRDDEDRPVASRDLVTRVRLLLSGIEQQAVKMRGRLLGGRGFDHRWQDELHWLYGELIPESVRPALAEARTVLIVPHHILHYFPFAALVTEPDAVPCDPNEMIDPRFWVEESFDTCYAPSLGSWHLLRQRPNRPVSRANALGIVDFQFAPRLPGVEQDLANFQSAFGDRVNEVLSGPDAQEGPARAILREPGLLLVATHGVNTADQPLYSHLMFQPDAENDGLLTAGELYGLPVGADLVVMSACYSGLADRSPLPGDDLFGLQRALLHSGARAVVSGLWDVYDGTGPDLIGGFFDHLNKKLTAPAALAASQRAFLQRLRQSEEPEPWLHPYFWAVYKCTGDDRVRLATDRR